MRQGRLIRRLGLGVAGVAAGALLGEGVARLLAPVAAEELLFNAPDAAPRGLYRFSKDLLTETTPGFTGEVASLGYRVPLRIDSHGLRGPEPGPGPNWVAVGDSFTISVQVREADTFPDRLGPKLGVSVLNAGVDGYSTWQATRRYGDLAAAVPLEGVLLTYFLGNDLHDNERMPVMMNRPMPPGQEGRALPTASTDPFTRFLFRHSVAYAYLRVATKRAALSRPDNFDARRFADELSIFTKGGAQRLAQLLPPTERALAQLRDAARSRRDRLLVAVAPPSFVVDAERAGATLGTFGLSDPDLDAPRLAVLDALRRLDIAACDLTPALQAAEDRGEKPYFRFDGHWTATGHAAVADALAACAGK